jgi:putative phosphonate metabolism protein
MTARFALYLAPVIGSRLAIFGNHWLGRDAESGASLKQPKVDGLDEARLRAITEAPRLYGFHGTLKPPFRLAEGRSEAELRHALAAFAQRQETFAVPALRLQQIGDFLALTPREPVPSLSALADACVTEFDSYRAPPEPAELFKRRAANLTPRQEDLLARWGYPYVLDEFRFHLSLTGSIADATERARLMALLPPLLAPALAEPMPVRELCLFIQPDRAAAFRLAQRFPFQS